MAKSELEFPKNTEPFAFMQTARRRVVEYVHAQNPDLLFADFTVENVNIIWFTTNDVEWRVLLGTTLNDGLYYRLGSDGKETKLDVYKMFDSQTFSNKDV